MGVFQVRQGATGAILWTGSAAGEAQALDAMAHEAGYRDHAGLPEGIRRGGLSAESLTFSTVGGDQRSVQGGRAGRTAERGGSAVGRNESPVGLRR